MLVRLTFVDIEPEDLVSLREVLGIEDLRRELAIVGERVIRLDQHVLAGRQENMANFDNLDAGFDALNSAIGDATNRVQADLDALKQQIGDDANDQAKIDELTSRLQSSVSALNNIDPAQVVQNPGDGSGTGTGDTGSGDGTTPVDTGDGTGVDDGTQTV